MPFPIQPFLSPPQVGVCFHLKGKHRCSLRRKLGCPRARTKHMGHGSKAKSYPQCTSQSPLKQVLKWVVHLPQNGIPLVLTHSQMPKREHPKGQTGPSASRATRVLPLIYIYIYISVHSKKPIDRELLAGEQRFCFLQETGRFLAELQLKIVHNQSA